jgi:hypothetical protein
VLKCTTEIQKITAFARASNVEREISKRRAHFSLLDTPTDYPILKDLCPLLSLPNPYHLSFTDDFAPKKCLCSFFREWKTF